MGCATVVSLRSSGFAPKLANVRRSLLALLAILAPPARGREHLYGLTAPDFILCAQDYPST